MSLYLEYQVTISKATDYSSRQLQAVNAVMDSPQTSEDVVKILFTLPYYLQLHLFTGPATRPSALVASS